MATSTTAKRGLKNEAGFNFQITADQIEVYLILDDSDFNEGRVTTEGIKDALRRTGVSYGVLDDEIDRMVSDRICGEEILIARGEAARDGRDAVLEYLFNTETTGTPKEDSDGRIDYKELDFIQNASAGDVLVRKQPATKGKPGKSVYGKELLPRTGKDAKIPVGSNTELSEDEIELKAKIDGSVVYAGRVVNIEPVQNIRGSIDSSTGNIRCSGTLKVAKDVKSGFRVEVKGDLEIAGQVHDAEIFCEGNVIVKGGFFGNGSGKIVAKGDVTVKWCDSQVIQSEGTITIGGEALNCRLYGKKAVIVAGSKGKLAGGEAASQYLVKAPCLGSDGGAKTILKVAFDPQTMRELRGVDAELKRIKEDTQRVKEGLTALYKAQMSGKLSSQKEAVLKKLEVFLKESPGKTEELKKNKESLENKLREIESATIIAEKAVYPGTIVYFGIVYKEILESLGPTKFSVDYDTIVPSMYDKRVEEMREQARKEAESKQPNK